MFKLWYLFNFFGKHILKGEKDMKYTQVKDLMTHPAITSEDSSTIKEAIETMKKNNIGFLPITRNNIIIGVLTDRDILIRAVGVYKLNSKLNKITTTGEIHFVNEDTPLIDAAKIMAKNKIRRLVVLNDGKVSGVLTTKNMLKEPTLLPYIAETYLENSALNSYAIYANSNPHDSVKTADYPL